MRPGALGSFAPSDENALRKFAADAKLMPVAVFDVDCPSVYPDEATAVRGLNASGVAVRAMENTCQRREMSEAHRKVIAHAAGMTGAIV